MQIDVRNYEKMYPIVVEKIKECCFIALDMEFTGLFLDPCYSPSLFDSLEDRYKKLRVNSQSFIPCQFGISLFSRNEDTKQYRAHTYSFYCCPRFYGTQANCCFTTDSGSIEFLADNSFDFNRFAQHGIPFLNCEQEQIFQNYMKDKFSIDLPISMLDRLNDLRNEIAAWYGSLKSQKGKKTGETVLPFKPFVNLLVNYLIVDKLRDEFKNIWIIQVDESLKVSTITPEERKILLIAKGQQEKAIIDYSLGLTRLVRAMIDSGKPIVGNNMMIDLVMLYQHFIQPLPIPLQDFKKQILSKFNVIFDVKSIVLNIKKDLSSFEEHFDARTLDELYQNLSNAKFIGTSPNQPLIIRDDDFESVDFCSHPHDAGSDAYASGYVFLRLCSVVASVNPENRNKGPPSWSQLLESILPFKNRINLIRAAFHFMDLEATSQKAVRPEWLVVKCRDKSQKLSVFKIHGLLSSYGTIDFKPANDKEIILAIGNFRAAREIIDKFRKDKNYKITKYNFIRDSIYWKLFLWATFATGASASGYLLFKAIRG